LKSLNNAFESTENAIDDFKIRFEELCVLLELLIQIHVLISRLNTHDSLQLCLLIKSNSMKSLKPLNHPSSPVIVNFYSSKNISSNIFDNLSTYFFSSSFCSTLTISYRRPAFFLTVLNSFDVIFLFRVATAVSSPLDDKSWKVKLKR